MLARVDTPTGSRIVRINGKRDAQRAVDLLFRRNCDIVAGLPPLYSSGVRYQREPAGRMEDWQAADRCAAAGFGDCEDLAAWRAAELVVSGADPSARPWVYQPRPRLLHVVTARDDGPEDPSAFLGMRRKMLNGVRYKFRGRSGAVECGIDFPIAGVRMKVRGHGASRAAAALDAVDRLNSTLIETGAIDGDEIEETGWVALVVAAAVAIAQALAPRFVTAPYDAAEDYPRGIAKAKNITLDESSREAMYASLLLGGWLPVYCSDSVGTRNEIFKAFTARGWTGGERWWQRYGSAAAQDVGSGKHYYGVHFPLANVPREWAQRAIDRAKTFPDRYDAIRRTGEFSINAKARMKAYGGDENFDEMLLDAIPVVTVPKDEVDPAEVSGLDGVGDLSDLFMMIVPGSGVRDVSPGAGTSSGPSLSQSNPFAGSGAGGGGGSAAQGALGALGAGLGALAKTGLPSGSPPSAGSRGPQAFVDTYLAGSGQKSADGAGVRGPQTAKSQAEQGAPSGDVPIVAPAAIDKIDRIRELGELVRDGHFRRVQSIIRKGGPVARFARELLR